MGLRIVVSSNRVSMLRNLSYEQDSVLLYSREEGKCRKIKKYRDLRAKLWKCNLTCNFYRGPEKNRTWYLKLCDMLSVLPSAQQSNSFFFFLFVMEAVNTDSVRNAN